MTRSAFLTVGILCSLMLRVSAAEKKTSVDVKKPSVLATTAWLPDEQMCPGPLDKFLTNNNIPWGVSGRAYRTVPPELDVYRSGLPGAGLGVWSTTFIPKHTWLAEYDGITVLPLEENHISWYTWTVYRGGKVLRYIDGGELETSNWLRFVNMPNSVYDENVMVRSCYNRVLYQTTKDIYPGQELLVHYGELYAKTLGIFEELTLSEAIRNAELELGNEEGMADVVVELKELMKLSGEEISLGLKKLLNDNDSAVSKTLGEKLNSRINKAADVEN